MSKEVKDSLVLGFCMFAIFFGAGNLIFPPFLGMMAGTKYPFAIIGFVLTDAGLSLLGILACAKSNSSFYEMTARVDKYFTIIAASALVITIGPLVAIPRTAATTFEISVLPFIPSANVLIAVILYFAITLLFVLKRSSIVDNIGSKLTPVLLVVLLILIVKGTLFPVGPIVDTGVKNMFPRAALEGYQTMDAIGSVITTAIILISARDKGYNSDRDVLRILIKSGIVCVVSLSIVYGGLTYLGSQMITILPADVPKTKIVTEISRRVLGNGGSIALSIIVALACLTTSIGLTSSAAEFFNKLTKNRISYNATAIIIVVISTFIATMGVDCIVSFAFPILQILYPVVMTLIIIVLLGDFVSDDRATSFTIYLTLIISVMDVLVNSLGFNIGFAKAILKFIPLVDVGFGWIVPAALALVGSVIYCKKFPRKVA
ncbi:branched-chain amino acid transport system 2 carrier protein [Clostridium acetireducens DSM 10703]|uniref:Branched-chain amino acid transport system carrier protein n=1 Tax=Clostridium acetireducens DSM 10703 TaxID=1121290 RepID=A0A1E8EYH9_9CLOT|nr:branched-chain amino acid transport system II carrier protein [Clostridium acetireducens]OFI05895.1 branched-chain amino acid transport system 2 carrier protein [Clostridium acetireducens DSM 10703]